MKRSAFTLVEVLGAVLVVVIGIGAVLALLHAGVRSAAVVQAQAMQQLTIDSLLHAAVPLGAGPMTLNNVRGWERVATTGSETGPSYTIKHRGYLNGFYALREEASSADDIVASSLAGSGLRWAEVQVELYLGFNGAYVTTGRCRILRRF